MDNVRNQLWKHAANVLPIKEIKELMPHASEASHVFWYVDNTLVTIHWEAINRQMTDLVRKINHART